MNTRTAGKTLGDAKHEAHGPKNPAPEAGMSRDVINIGQNIFKHGIKDYSEKEKELLEWLWGYAFEDLKGSRSALCEATGYDWTVIHKIFSGRYEASLDRFCDVIKHLRKKATNGRVNLVKTVIVKRIMDALDYARDSNTMVAICGPTGRSKTFTAKAWARDNNHDRAKYVRIPSGCTLRMLVQSLCRKCGIGVNGKKTDDLKDRLFKAFDFHNTIIVDEAGHLLPRCGKGTSAIEFLRDLNEVCECGVVMIFTATYLEEMRNGRLAEFFEQFIGRISAGYELRIPNEVRRGEVKAVVEAFVSNPSNKLLGLALNIARRRDGKLRTLFADLERAKDWAESHSRKMTYDDLKLATDWRLSGGVWPEDI